MVAGSSGKGGITPLPASQWTGTPGLELVSIPRCVPGWQPLLEGRQAPVNLTMQSFSISRDCLGPAVSWNSSCQREQTRAQVFLFFAIYNCQRCHHQ